MTIAYVAGLGPRSPQYMRAHWDHAKGFGDAAALEAAQQEERRRWQAAQNEAGLDLLSPSYVETEDILRPLTRLAGCEAGALTRTFETNTFHRRPVFSAPVAQDGLRDWVELVRLDVPWVLSLPSPYDVVQRSEFAVGAAEAADSIAACLRDAARHALGHGAAFIRFQEPTAAYRGHATSAEVLEHLLEIATHGIQDRAVVHFTQGDVLARADILDAVPCAIGIDVAATSAPARPVLEGRRLHAGVVRGQSSLVETAAAGAQAVAIAEAAGAELSAITNGWDLEHVPFDVATAKLQALAATRAVEVLA